MPCSGSPSAEITIGLRSEFAATAGHDFHLGIRSEAAQRRVEALEKAAVPEAAEALRLTELSYREGRSSLLELLDAQNALIDEQVNYEIARLGLLRDLGILFIDETGMWKS